MSRGKPTETQLQAMLDAEIKKYKALSEKEAEILENGTGQDYKDWQLQITDVQEEIAHLFSKLHPMLPNGGCPHCGGFIEYGSNSVRCINCGKSPYGGIKF